MTRSDTLPKPPNPKNSEHLLKPHYRLVDRVIVTGADGSGKSTLIDQLVNDPNGPCLSPFLGHDGGPPLTSQEVWARLNHFTGAGAGIKDRCVAVDEPVYSQALNRATPVSPKLFDAWLTSIRPTIIFCYREDGKTNISTEAKAHKPAELLEQVQSHRDEIIYYYVMRMKFLRDRLGLTVIPYDYTKLPFPELLAILESAGTIIPMKEIH